VTNTDQAEQSGRGTRANQNPGLGHSTIPEVLRAAVDRFADRPWMVFRGEEWTFDKLGARVDALIKGLRHLGIGSGDRVGLFLGNCLDWLPLEYAVVSVGAALVPLNTALRARELDYILGKSDMTALFWGDRVVGHDTLALLDSLLPELAKDTKGGWSSERFSSLRHVIGIGSSSWPKGVSTLDDLLAMVEEPAPTAALNQPVRPDDVALIIFTSGTTGAPKGALIRHSSIVDHLAVWGQRIGLTTQDRSILTSPLFWTFGCTMNAVVPLLAGSSIVLDDRFEPEQFLSDLARYQCTHLQGVPTQYELALNHPTANSTDLSAIRLIQIGGSSSIEPLVHQIQAMMPKAELVSAYGLTEAVICSTWTEQGDSLEDIVHTVGHAAPDNELELRDVETRELVGPGEVGEIWLKGPNVTRGYLGDPEATSAAIVDGWFNTGDLAVRDTRGYFSIVGRSVDAFKRGGANVYPAEIEAVLAEHPAVLQVAVLGVPEPIQGEVGLACIVPADAHPTAEELLEYCRGLLASYKVPAHFRFVEELPLTPTGKVQKFVLRQAWIEETTQPC